VLIVLDLCQILDTVKRKVVNETRNKNEANVKNIESMPSKKHKFLSFPNPKACEKSHETVHLTGGQSSQMC
jgi:hypothetical protein